LIFLVHALVCHLIDHTKNQDQKMTSLQAARLGMCRALKVTCDAHTAAWSGMTDFATPFGEFSGLLETVEGIIGRQGVKSTGSTMAKDALRHTLEGQAMHIADTLVLHFKKLNKEQERRDMYTTPSELSRLGEEALAGRLSRIIAAAAGVTPATLTALGLDPAELTAASANLESFIALQKTPRHIRAESRRATEDLAVALDDLMEIVVEDLDPAANVLRYSKPEFFSEYQTAREIEDAGNRTRELTVNVRTGEGQGVAGVKMLITPGNINKVTSPKGTFYILNLEGGSYTGVLNAPGYKPKTVEFAIIDNQATVLDLTLEAEA
jgi:hypothetical protein